MKKILIVSLLFGSLNATEINNKDIKTVKKIMAMETKLTNCFIKLVGLEYKSARWGGAREICNRSMVVKKLTCDKGIDKSYAKAVKKSEAQRRKCFKIDSAIRDKIFGLRKTPFKISVSRGG